MRRRDGEAVELALDQREGAPLRVRVLGGDHHVGLREGPRLAVDADLALLHRLEERRLGAGRGAVQLVDEDDVGEDRSGPEVPAAGVGHEDRDAGDVGRQEVGMALDPGQLRPEGGGQGPGQHRLADARHVLDEEVAPGERGRGRGHQGTSSLPSTTRSRLRTSAWPSSMAASMPPMRSSRTLTRSPPRGPSPRLRLGTRPDAAGCGVALAGTGADRGRWGRERARRARRAHLRRPVVHARRRHRGAPASSSRRSGSSTTRPTSTPGARASSTSTPPPASRAIAGPTSR